MNLIDLQEITVQNCCRSKEEEKMAAKTELEKLFSEPPVKKNRKEITQKDISDLFSKLKSKGLSEKEFLCLTGEGWFYFKNPEDEFVIYEGKFVWKKKEGFLI